MKSAVGVWAVATSLLAACSQTRSSHCEETGIALGGDCTTLPGEGSSAGEAGVPTGGGGHAGSGAVPPGGVSGMGPTPLDDAGSGGVEQNAAPADGGAMSSDAGMNAGGWNDGGAAMNGGATMNGGAAGESSIDPSVRCNVAAAGNCDCGPLEAGATGLLPYEGWIRKLVADPIRCRLYGLSGFTPPEVLVIDTQAKAELTRISLPGLGSDIDMSPNGEWLVVTQDAAGQLLLIDPDRALIKASQTVGRDPQVVEVDDSGVAYYAGFDRSVGVRRIDLKAGMSSDTSLAVGNIYMPDLELSRDGAFLYAGESGLSSSFLYKFDVTNGGATRVAKGAWTDGFGYVYSPRSLLLSAYTPRTYYGWYEQVGDDLGLVIGRTKQSVFVEDQAGTFAVGENTVFDSVTLRTLSALPKTATAAALTGHDTVLWYYDGASGDGHYANVDDLIGHATLGARDVAPQSLNAYTFSKLIADPVRRRLYAMDSARSEILSIDSDTLQPLSAVIVGTAPSDLALDFAGTTLFVGHGGALGIARIRLTDFTFERFLKVSRIPFEIEPLSNGRLATIDQDQWTTPSIIDADTGVELASIPHAAHEGVLSATVDGRTLFVGDSRSSICNMTRYDVSDNAFVQVDKTSYRGGLGFESAGRWQVCLPDGSADFYAGYLIDGQDLSVLKYQVASAVRTITPDAKLATTSGTVIDVATGKKLGDLGTIGDVQVLDSTGNTLYIATPGALTKVNLAAFR